jgi:hypothetical protein
VQFFVVQTLKHVAPHPRLLVYQFCELQISLSISAVFNVFGGDKEKETKT